MKIEELLKAWNAQRKANRDKWVFFDGDLDGSTVRIKSYNLWIQRIEYRDYIDGKASATVKAATDFIRGFLEG
jgi:hypothetical protein